MENSTYTLRRSTENAQGLVVVTPDNKTLKFVCQTNEPPKADGTAVHKLKIADGMPGARKYVDKAICMALTENGDFAFESFDDDCFKLAGNTKTSETTKPASTSVWVSLDTSVMTEEDKELLKALKERNDAARKAAKEAAEKINAMKKVIADALKAGLIADLDATIKAVNEKNGTAFTTADFQ